MKINMQNELCILVIKLDHLGDLLLATPVFRAIKERYPQARVDAFINPMCRDILENNPFVDNIYTFFSKDFDRNKDLDAQMLVTNMDNIRQVRANHYDLTIGLREDLNNIPIQLLCGARYNVNFSTHTQYSKFLDRCAENDDYKHSALINFDLLKLIDIPMPKNVHPEINLIPQDKQWVVSFLSNSAVDIDNALNIAFSIGGGWFLNLWPIDCYVALAEKLSEVYPNAVFFLMGGKAEQKLADYFATHANVKFVDVTGKASIAQTVALYQRMDLVIANDGGPMHMATAADVPLIALFGPSPDYRFGPCGQKSVVISKHFPCSPCPQFVRGQTPTCTDNKCMQSITVEDVYKVVEEIIATK